MSHYDHPKTRAALDQSPCPPNPANVPLGRGECAGFADGVARLGGGGAAEGGENIGARIRTSPPATRGDTAGDVKVSARRMGGNDGTAVDHKDAAGRNGADADLRRRIMPWTAR